MKMEVQGDTLRVLAVRELGAANSAGFRDWICEGMVEGLRNIEIDLSETTFLDSCGLGALIALHKTTCKRQGRVRLLHPQTSVQQILDLTRLHRLFEIVKHSRADEDAVRD